MTDGMAIGDVLEELREEFPDVTVSKIRFLESQGLIEPERTASGYRQFAPDDLQKLRWILQQQKDHFLPLKVIRERLTQLELGDGMFTQNTPAKTAPSESRPASGKPPRLKRGSGKGLAAILGNGSGNGIVRVPEEIDEGPSDFVSAESAASFTKQELAQAAGMDVQQVTQLASYGLIEPSSDIPNEELYDEEALIIARAAKSFFDRGIDVRHLRMYRNAAERELGTFEQVLLPILKKRNPEARVEARKELEELAQHGRILRGAFLRLGAHKLLNE